MSNMSPYETIYMPLKCHQIFDDVIMHQMILLIIVIMSCFSLRLPPPPPVMETKCSVSSQTLSDTQVCVTQILHIAPLRAQK